MAFSIALRNTLPNQRFTVVLERTLYEIDVKTIGSGANQITLMSVTRANEVIIRNQRVLPNENVIPYGYQFDGFGNFRFVTDSDNYPVYTEFGVSVILTYFTAGEIASGN